MTERTALPIETEEQQVLILNYFKERCQGAERNEPVSNASGLFCPAVWDNATCWHAARAGELVVKPCPPYLLGVNLEEYARKQCMQDGRWYEKPSTQWHYTNYTLCNPGFLPTVVTNFHAPNVSYYEEYIPALKTIHTVGFSLSLITLIIALVILATNKRLRCPRNIVHMHLFVSFILRAFFGLLKDSAFVNGVGLSFNFVDNDKVFVSNQDSICKFVTCMWQYSRMAIYSWLLMEGLYLHNLIFLALFSDTSSIRLYIILGWGLPVLVLLPWVGLRIGLNNHLCWVTTETMPFISLIIEVPITVSLLINTIFFLNIVRVLLHKIKATFVEKTQTYRKWAKSTLVLVPLFGVHYILFLGMNWIPEKHRNACADIVWLFCDQFFSSLQGFVVAILYCFLNGEVKSELNRKWQSIRRKKASDRKLSTFTKTSSVHGTYCTTASSASLNSLKWGNTKVGQPAQCTNDKKLSPFYPHLTETTRLNSYGNFNAGNSEEKDWSRPSEHTANTELGCLIP